MNSIGSSLQHGPDENCQHHGEKSREAHKKVDIGIFLGGIKHARTRFGGWTVMIGHKQIPWLYVFSQRRRSVLVPPEGLWL
jgi:hypothetical protein